MPPTNKTKVEKITLWRAYQKYHKGWVLETQEVPIAKTGKMVYFDGKEFGQYCQQMPMSRVNREYGRTPQQALQLAASEAQKDIETMRSRFVKREGDLKSLAALCAYQSQCKLVTEPIPELLPQYESSCVEALSAQVPQLDLGYPRTSTTAMMRAKFDNGEVWEFSVQLVANDRDQHYSSDEEDTIGFIRSQSLDRYDLNDWAANNMNWSDFAPYARKVETDTPLAYDYQHGWLSANISIVGAV